MNLAHGRSSLFSFGNEEDFAVLPGQVIQIAKWNFPIWLKRVIHFPCRLIPAGFGHRFIVSEIVTNEVQSQRLEQAIPFCQENNSSRPRRISEEDFQLWIAQSAHAVSLTN